MISKSKPKFEPLIQKIAFPFRNINPNILTLIGLIPPVLFFILIQFGLYYWAVIAYLGIAIDTIDGAVARRNNKITNFGKFFDSSLDRISDFLFISAFAFAHIISFELALVLVFLSIFISYLRTRAEAAGDNKFTLNVGIIERPERLAIILFSLILYIIFPGAKLLNLNIIEIGFIILILLSFVTIIQRFVKAYQELNDK